MKEGSRLSGGKGARQIGRISVLLSLNRLTTGYKLDWKLEMPRWKSRDRFSASRNLRGTVQKTGTMQLQEFHFISCLAT